MQAFLRSLGINRSLCALLLLGAGLLAGSCGGSAGTGTDSNTHWLRGCTADSECGSLACVCGACKRRCADDRECSGLRGATCAASSACSSGEENRTCQALCSTDGDCSALDAGLHCDSGTCRARSEGSGGSPATGGSGGATGGGGNVTGGGGSGGAGSDECATPMQVNGDGTPCTASTARYFWTGKGCMPFQCDTCEGADCDKLYASASACDLAHAACYESAGVTRACTVNSDCSLTIRGCCGSCGLVDERQLLGIRADESSAYGMNLCREAACPACVSSIDPRAYPVCEAGLCAVKTRPSCAGLDQPTCASTASCQVRSGTDASGATVYAGCRYSGADAPLCNTVLACGHEDVPDGVCLRFSDTCVPDGWVVDVSCASPGCPP
jgi:hypothetical protein